MPRCKTQLRASSHAPHFSFAGAPHQPLYWHWYPRQHQHPLPSWLSLRADWQRIGTCCFQALQADKGSLLWPAGDCPSAGSRCGAGLANTLGELGCTGQEQARPLCVLLPHSAATRARSFDEGRCLPISLSCWKHLVCLAPMLQQIQQSILFMGTVPP